MVWHGFLQDISARKQADDEVRRLNAELEARVGERTRELELRNKEMEAFTYSVSHDLKAPLRGIDGYSRLLLTDHAHALDAEGRQFVDTIRKATAHMARLIDDLLAYSKVERSRPTLGLIDPCDVAQRVVDQFRAEIEQGQVELQLRLECRRAFGERDGLSMALRNLVDNALKFTQAREARRISVECVETATHCRISVSDNGLGFDMRYHDRIFEIFQRLHRAEEFPGTGVGLAIVRKAVERMQGRVHALSSPGQGASFVIELPLPA
jgi:signal transduction histidine kinase